VAAGGATSLGTGGEGGLPRTGNTAGTGAGGSAGVGGDDSGTMTTDAEFCAEQCAATPDHYQFPAVFCEDWQYPSSKRVAAYCGPLEGTDCASGCAAKLSRMTDACNAALRVAIPCAAKVYPHGPAPATMSCFLGQCASDLGHVSAECNGFREELAGARARWNASGSSDYTFRWNAWTVVVANGVASVAEPGFIGEAPTIPALFDHVDALLDLGVAPVITYDETLGYPRSATFKIPCGSLLDEFEVSDLALR